VNTRLCTALIALAVFLDGCGTSTTAVIDSLRHALPTDSQSVDRLPLNPNFRYLRVTIAGRTVLLVLGYTENHHQGPIEVWYSAEREVLRIQNGRIVGAAGTTTEWRNVKFSPFPSWASIAKPEGAGTRLSRVRDEMPGYRYGITDDLMLSTVPPPQRSALSGVDPGSLAWFQETIVPKDQLANSNQKQHAASRYAVKFDKAGDIVVYGEQCLSPTFCLTWQRWPAVTGNP
jgi:hypothetical protein